MFKFLLLVPVNYPWQVLLLAGGDIREKVETCLPHSSRASVAAVLCHLLIITIHMTEPKLENSVLTTVGERCKAVLCLWKWVSWGGGIGTNNVLSHNTLDGYAYAQAIHCISTFSSKHLMFFIF